MWNKLWKKIHQSSVENTDLFMKISVKKKRKKFNQLNQVRWLLPLDLSIYNPRLNVHTKEGVPS